MSFDSDASSSVVKTNEPEVQPSASGFSASLKYLLLIGALAIPYVSAFLAYPLRTVSGWLSDIRWVYWFFIFLVSLGMLLLRRWVGIAIFAVAWAWLIFTPYKFEKPFDWLFVEGFRIHASPVDGYPSRCRLVQFVENGAKQTLGFCEGTDRGAYIRSVFYDTTDEFVLPLSQRTAEWVQAASELVSEEYFDARAVRLFENFYTVDIPLADFRG